MRIRLDPVDKLFSVFVRKRSKGYCERCLQYKGWERLQCCHFHSRRMRSTRYDPDNACALDFGCHQYLDSHPLEKIEFFKARLGEEAFEMLQHRARQIGKPDKEAIKLYLQEQIKEI